MEIFPRLKGRKSFPTKIYYIFSDRKDEK